jgi:flagellar biosynthesis/type III secretory pathway M-ring protein FliF/YscJ
MTGELLQTADHLASKSPWVWVLLMFMIYLLGAWFAVRYLVIKRDEGNDKLLNAEQEKVKMMEAMMKDRESLHREYNEKSHTMSKDILTAVHDANANSRRVTEVLERIDRALEKRPI